MKRFLLLSIIIIGQLIAIAQERPKFDPRRFETDLEQYVVTQAGLSPQEAAKFLPAYKELRCKQRALFMKMDNYRHVDFSNEKQCEKAICDMDEIDLNMKELQHRYHVKFLRILPASKVLKVIRAEERFHRTAFRKAASQERNNHKRLQNIPRHK